MDARTIKQTRLMKTKEEIEQAAEQYWYKQLYNEDAYIVGYTQCQLDMADKKLDA